MEENSINWILIGIIKVKFILINFLVANVLWLLLLLLVKTIKMLFRSYKCRLPVHETTRINVFKDVIKHFFLNGTSFSFSLAHIEE